MNTSPGWYADPAGNPVERFWDGNAWTGQTRPGRVQAPAFAGPTAHPAPFLTAGQPTLPWFKRKRFIVPAAIVGTLIVVGAIGAVNQPAPKTTPAANAISATSATSPDAHTTPVTSTATSPATATTVASATTAAKPTHTVASTSHAPKPAAATTSNADAGSFRMPNEVGSILQDAQDDVQRVSGDPVFFSHSHDLLGVRFQILDRDWKVCTQNVPAGTRVSAVAHIDFGVVKLEESCP